MAELWEILLYVFVVGAGALLKRWGDSQSGKEGDRRLRRVPSPAGGRPKERTATGAVPPGHASLEPIGVPEVAAPAEWSPETLEGVESGTEGRAGSLEGVGASTEGASIERGPSAPAKSGMRSRLSPWEDPEEAAKSHGHPLVPLPLSPALVKEAVLWTELLGPPRALRPYRPPRWPR